MKDLAKIREWLRSVGADESKLDENGRYEGYLDLSSLTSIPEGFNPTVGGSLDLSSLTSIPEGFNPTVGGSLYLSSLTSIPEGFNPTVGGSLYLNSLTSIPEGFNPTVGGSLYLRSLTSIPEGFNPTVGGSLYLRSREIYRGDTVNIPAYFHWKWRNSEYIKADGIFQKVVSHKGNVYRVQAIGKDKITYLVTDGNGKWSHGDTLHDAKEDLVYKISNRDKSAYASLTLDSVLTHAEAIEAYRVITGACSAGTKAFVTSLDPKQLKDSYTIREIIELTKGNFGAEAFAEFFSKH